MTARKPPEGFEVKEYPDITPDGPDHVDLFVCQTCTPQWDTFSRELAEAHAAAGMHQAIGQEIPAGMPVPGQEEQKG